MGEREGEKREEKGEGGREKGERRKKEKGEREGEEGDRGWGDMRRDTPLSSTPIVHSTQMNIKAEKNL